MPRLFIVPNEPAGLLSLEEDGTRQDVLPALAAAGYELTVDEPAILDEGVRGVLGLHDRHLLFERR